MARIGGWEASLARDGTGRLHCLLRRPPPQPPRRRRRAAEARRSTAALERPAPSSASYDHPTGAALGGRPHLRMPRASIPRELATPGRGRGGPGRCASCQTAFRVQAARRRSLYCGAITCRQPSFKQYSMERSRSRSMYCTTATLGQGSSGVAKRSAQGQQEEVRVDSRIEPLGTGFPLHVHSRDSETVHQESSDPSR